jgi:hypothetical protein
MAASPILVRDSSSTARQDAPADSLAKRPAALRAPGPILRPRTGSLAPATAPLPKVWLQLPDVSKLETTSARRFSLASQLYWAAIVLGALLAGALIWSGKKAPIRDFDDAPAWSSPTTGSAEQAGPAQVGIGPSDASDRPAEITARAPALPTTGGSAAPTSGSESVPSIENPGIEPAVESTTPAVEAPGDATAPSDDQPPTPRTARITELRLSDGAPRARPSEAVPLGINTSVTP